MKFPFPKNLFRKRKAESPPQFDVQSDTQPQKTSQADALGESSVATAVLSEMPPDSVFVPATVEDVSTVHAPTSLSSAKRRRVFRSSKKMVQTQGLRKAVEAEDKKITAIGKISIVWTVISTVYAIASTCLLIWRGWVPHTVSYVLVGILALYVCVFITLVVLVFRNPKSGKKNVNIYKKIFQIFKIVVNIVYLVMTAISLAGMTQVGMNEVFKWILFALSFGVAVIQLGLKVALLVMKIARMIIAKKFRVEVERFIDGRRQKKNLRAKLEERKYAED